ncbi:hypothetical protein FRB99_008730 [Tulasnella sp. 403]|nr:hypothetical protein FRB99_008730 [Tulasnella sp. 403]
MATPVSGPLPPFRTHQGVDLTGFIPPPLDYSVTLPQIFDHHRQYSSSHTFYRYEGDDGEIKTIPWGDLVKAVHRAARIVKTAALDAGVQDGENAVFGILAATDTITYITTLMGVLRAGFTGFPISSRNSPAALAHLLGKTNAKVLITTQDDPTQALVSSGIQLLSENGNAESTSLPKVVVMPRHDQLYPEEETEFEYLPDMAQVNVDSPAVILHSSGSTAFPKPIVYLHRNLLEAARGPYYGGVDIGSDVLAAHGLPPFHAIGIVSTCWAAATGMQIGVFKPASPPTIPTPQKVFDGIVAVQATRAFVVPMFIETWSRDEAAVEVLKNLKGVIYSGGPMNVEIGHELTAKGVSLRPAYGSTETGFMNLILPSHPMGEDWEYFEFSDHVQPAFLNNGDEQYELLLVVPDTPFKPCSSHTPGHINTTWEGKPAYSTNDLLVRHPTNPNLWRIYGRADDQIMLSSGEKTNPGPIESILCKDPFIDSAIMFGRGRFQNGVIIQPKPQFQFDPSDEEKLAAFRSAIWKTVEEANAYAPTHSRLFKEMIIVSDPRKPFQVTPKGTPKRKAVVQDYDAEIEALYTAIEESSMSEIKAPEEWTETSTRDFVRTIVQKVLEAPCEDDEDMFSRYGADSLQVTWIRNAVLQALRSSKVVVNTVPQNFVYNHPTISSLSRYVYRVATPASADANLPSELDLKVEELTNMVSKYTSDIRPTSSQKDPLSDVIFLTGSTGALGTNILAQLLALPEVKRVYAFNRPDRGGVSLKDKHAASFRDRGVEESLLDSEKLVFVEGDASKADLGLSAELFAEVSDLHRLHKPVASTYEITRQIRDTTTHYILNAWPVNFNVALSSFEPSIKSVRNVIDMALASPQPSTPRVIFTSSVATLRNYTGTTAAPECAIEDPRSPAGAGYGESKWVAERILQTTSKRTSLRPIVVRVGQLSGGLNGNWNSQEWLPSIIRSAQSVKCLPDGAGEVSWLPLHVAATAVVQMRDSEADVLHLAHPRPVAWTEVFGPISKALGVPLVSYDEWLRKLDESLGSAPSEVEAAKENPALRLIDFFRSNNAGTPPPGREAGGLPKLATDIAVQVAPCLTEEQLPPLSERDALSWVEYWQKTGFLSA